MKLALGVPIIILSGIYLIGYNLIKQEVNISFFIGIVFILMGFIKFHYDNKKFSAEQNPEEE